MYINSNVNGYGTVSTASGINYTPAGLQYQRKESSMYQSIAAMKDGLEKDLKENLIKLQGTIFELQRVSGKEEEFNTDLYEKLTLVTNSMNDLQKCITHIQEQIAYCVDVLNGLKLSQELTDGFSSYQRQFSSHSDYAPGYTYGSTTIGGLSNIGVATTQNVISNPTFIGTPTVYASGNVNAISSNISKYAKIDGTI